MRGKEREAPVRSRLTPRIAPLMPSVFKGREISPSPCPPLAVWPQDPWPCDPQTGPWLLSGLMEYPAGFDAAVDAFWSGSDSSGSSAKASHNFSWLLELKAMGGDHARQSARILTASWVEKYRSSKKYSVIGHDSMIVAHRLLTLIQTYDFHGASAHDSYQSLISHSVLQDGGFLYKKLSRRLSNITGGKDLFFEACALLSASVCLEDNAHKEWKDIGEDNLVQALEVQILPDGGHITRNPHRLVETLKHCLDLKRLYQVVHLPFPEPVQSTIDRMAQALKFFRYTDKKLAVFHGAKEGDNKKLDLILQQTGQNKRVVKTLPHSGFERLTQGRTMVLMDVGNAPPSPFDRQAHCAPLAFEFSHGRDRVIVNCGTSFDTPQWADVLRRTAAHSTLALDDTDVMHIKDNGDLRDRPKRVSFHRTQDKDSILLEAMHDGYDLDHVRRLYLSCKGHDLRGEDTLIRETLKDTPLDMEGAVRFHLHPKVRVSLIRNGEAVLLRLRSGVGWIFQQSGAHLALEDSIYMGAEETKTPTKTKQIVLRFNVNTQEKRVKWAFQREA